MHCLRHYTATAAQQVQIYVSLAAEPATLGGVARVIEESQLSGKFQGVQGKSCIMIHFDVQLFSLTEDHLLSLLPSSKS